MKHFVLWVILLGMPLRSSVAAQPPRQGASSSSEIANVPQVRTALDWFEPNVISLNELQVTLAEIPAPSFQEKQRAAAIEPLLREAGLEVRRDQIGNVIGELRGSNEKKWCWWRRTWTRYFPGART